jgi:uncharacterized phage-associated protein
MLLLGAGVAGRPSQDAIQGTTRLQKLLFLIEQEAGVKATEGKDFDFSAYKFGPVSKELYDDLEKLENLGLLEAKGVAEPSESELGEYDLSFEDLMGEEEQESKEALEERRFKLTSKGIRWLNEKIVPKVQPSVAEKIRKVRGKYGSFALSDLLYYVYTKYPAWTSASEIKDRVLGH